MQFSLHILRSTLFNQDPKHELQFTDSKQVQVVNKSVIVTYLKDLSPSSGHSKTSINQFTQS